jgi:hypothetical protein
MGRKICHGTPTERSWLLKRDDVSRQLSGGVRNQAEQPARWSIFRGLACLIPRQLVSRREQLGENGAPFGQNLGELRLEDLRPITEWLHRLHRAWNVLQARIGHAAALQEPAQRRRQETAMVGLHLGQCCYGETR